MLQLLQKKLFKNFKFVCQPATNATSESLLRLLQLLLWPFQTSCDFGYPNNLCPLSPLSCIRCGCPPLRDHLICTRKWSQWSQAVWSSLKEYHIRNAPKEIFTKGYSRKFGLQCAPLSLLHILLNSGWSLKYYNSSLIAIKLKFSYIFFKYRRKIMHLYIKSHSFTFHSAMGGNKFIAECCLLYILQ